MLDVIGRKIAVGSRIVVLQRVYNIKRATVTGFTEKFVKFELDDGTKGMAAIGEKKKAAKVCLIPCEDTGVEDGFRDAVGNDLKVGDKIVARQIPDSLSCKGFEDAGKITRFTKTYVFSKKRGVKEEIKRKPDLVIVVPAK